jgi:hypothetical protein
VISPLEKRPSTLPAIFAAVFWTISGADILVMLSLPELTRSSEWFQFGSAVLIQGAAAAWLYADSLAYPNLNGPVYAAWTLLFPEFSVPIYLVRSRGWGGAAKTALWIGAIFCGWMVLVALVGVPLKVSGIIE